MSRPSTCVREAEVLDLIAIGQWPARADANLAAHVAACECCADLAIVAMAVTDVRDAAHAAVHVPDASLVWYRAQIRARQDAARRAARPMFLVQVAGLVLVAAGLTIWSGGLTHWLTGALATSWASVTDMFSQPAGFDQSIESAQQLWSPASGAWSWALLAMGGGTLLAVSLAVGLSRLADGPEAKDSSTT